ncbi:MAG: hypothetical protein PHN18_00910 [Sulfurospirillaceae bacterium]|nr:hypothetical protein [Sulfurospirillaceae bacterium]MDD2826100.1 hypothetical protein [Sulfurospirillaceae bacterium]
MAYFKAHIEAHAVAEFIAVVIRQRKVVICELEDSFMIEFLEAIKEEMHTLTEALV